MTLPISAFCSVFKIKGKGNEDGTGTIYKERQIKQ